MLVPDVELPGSERVKILDFGIAKLVDGVEDSGAPSVQTRSGVLLGTPTYMAPEQCRGTGTVEVAADVYSLGVMLFEVRGARRAVESSAARGRGERCRNGTDRGALAWCQCAAAATCSAREGTVLGGQSGFGDAGAADDGQDLARIAAAQARGPAGVGLGARAPHGVRVVAVAPGQQQGRHGEEAITSCGPRGAGASAGLLRRAGDAAVGRARSHFRCRSG